MIYEKQILELRRKGKLESTKLKVKAEENMELRIWTLFTQCQKNLSSLKQSFSNELTVFDICEKL